MNNEHLPKDQALIAFTDLEGNKRTGFYSQDLDLFLESAGNSAKERTGRTFREAEVESWEYLSDERPDSDYMVIL